MKREFRTFTIELRKKKEEGKPTEITGHAAVFNEMSVDMWGWRERIMPGAFTRAIKEKQDVRGLINHDPNLVIGRTKSGTLELGEDKQGLTFNCNLPDTSYARDIAETVGRGDIDQCSFGFIARKATWSEEPDPDNPKEQIVVRQIEDVDLFDISVVTYPAYEGTDASARMEMRSIALENAPPAIRRKLGADKKRLIDITDLSSSGRILIEQRDTSCECDCPECVAGDCDKCSDPDCEDPNCEGSMSRNSARARVRAIHASL